jgi:outer membrane lipoprotein-sorting protein
MGGPPVTGAPYSATRTETRQQTLADGNQIQETHTATIYRDAEGRTRMESTMKTPSGETRTMITIFDPVAGFVAHLNPADSTAMKETLPAPRTGGSAPPKPPTDANAPQMVKTDLGTGTVAGLAATGTKTTVTIPAGAMGNTEALVETHEVWFSTALKIPVKVTSSDPRRGTSTMLLSNISQTAPDESLFQIPAAYTVKNAPAHGPGGPGGPPPPVDGGSN